MAAGGTGRAALDARPMRPWLVVLVTAVVLAAGCGGDGDPAIDDGRHFGMVTELDPEAFRLGFDEATLLEGDDARDAADDDGGVLTEEGSYVRNPDSAVTRVTLDGDIVIRLLRPCCELHEVSLREWHAGFEPDDRTFYGTASSRYWITVTDGKVTAVDEAYVP